MRATLLILLVINTLTTFGQATVAFTIPDTTLFPEGIAYSKRHQTFYISSILKDKIVQVNNKRVSDFIPSQFAGFMGGIGLHVDETRDVLWANFGRVVNGKRLSGLMAFRLSDGQLLRRFTLPIDENHLLNDLIIAPDGTVYVTDTFTSSLYRYTPQSDTLLRWLRDDRLAYPNGITITPDGKILFVASDRNGIYAINCQTKKVDPVGEDALMESTKGIDGLVYYNHDLIGIVNGPEAYREHRIVRFRRQRNGQIDHVQVLDQHNPLYAIPTTGVVVGRMLYCIANSHIDRLEQTKNTVLPGKPLSPPLILQYRLH